MLESGSLCSDAKSRPVKDAESCRSAVPKLQNLDQRANFEEEERTENWPAGCYLTTDGVYFNSHSTGGRNPFANHICRTGISDKDIEYYLKIKKSCSVIAFGIHVEDFFYAFRIRYFIFRWLVSVWFG